MIKRKDDKANDLYLKYKTSNQIPSSTSVQLKIYNQKNNGNTRA